MSEARKYLLTLVGAALLISLVQAFPQKKALQRVLSLCGGLFLMLTLLKPVLSFKFGDLGELLQQFEMDPALIEETLEKGQNESARLITEQTQEYILDKAAELGAELSVEVTLKQLSENYRYPYQVTLRGRWTAEQTQALRLYIAQTLGIPEERQIWNADLS